MFRVVVLGIAFKDIKETLCEDSSFEACKYVADAECHKYRNFRVAVIDSLGVVRYYAS